MRRCTIIVLATGLALITLGIAFGILLFPNLIQRKVKQQFRLEEGGDLYNKWVDVKLPIYMKVYLFKITNPNEFAVGEKPILEEVGPYVYRQKRQKVVESHNPENDTLKFRPKITYFFEEEMSEGRKETDLINFINVPLLGLTAKATKSGGLIRSLIQTIVEEQEETLFTERTVGEFLFKGYHQPTIAELSSLQGEELMPGNRFGIYVGKNGTAQDLFEIHSGIVENEKFGMTISWNGKSELDYWTNEYCNMINGSDGSIFPPFLTRDRVVRIFSPDMCRSIYMTYVEDVEVKGIPAYRFTTPKEVMEDPRVYAENRCYCPEAEDEDELDRCTKSGVFRISPCRKGAPIVASFPHFYGGDEAYVQQAEGLNPIKELHETFLSLEPNTGALLQASKRFQVNIEIKPSKTFKQIKKIRPMILPVLWVDESVVVNDETADTIKEKLLSKLKFGPYGMFGLMGIGALLIVMAIILMLFPGGKKGSENITKS